MGWWEKAGRKMGKVVKNKGEEQRTTEVKTRHGQHGESVRGFPVLEAVTLG